MHYLKAEMGIKVGYQTTVGSLAMFSERIGNNLYVGDPPPSVGDLRSMSKASALCPR